MRIAIRNGDEVVEVIVNNALAATQFGIGNLGLGEGSVEHALLHGLAGCAFAEATGGDCAAGLASGIAQSVYAGYVDRNGLDKAAAVETAALIGAGVGFLFSSGEGQNVTLGNTAAQSGFLNNYLSHGESLAFEAELYACEPGDKECFNRVALKYQMISEANDAAFAECATDECRAWHFARVEAAEFSGAYARVSNFLEQNQIVRGATTNYAMILDDLQYTRADDYFTSGRIDEPARVAFLRDEISANHCGGGAISSCDIKTMSDMYRHTLLTRDEVVDLQIKVAQEFHRLEEMAREEMRVEVCGAERGASCEQKVDAEIEADRKFWNRVEGGVNATFGLVEIGGATYICGQSLGAACIPAAAVALHGADTYAAGWNQLVTGERHITIGAAFLMDQLGLSEATATLLYDGMSMGGEIIAARALLKQAIPASRVIADDIANGQNIVYVERGSTGEWSKLLNKPEPNTTYRLDNGDVYITNADGKVERVAADLSHNPNARNGYQQRVSGRTCRLSTDCGGHLIASVFGGAGEGINLVPMNVTLNGSGGRWYRMEQDWLDALHNGQSVSVDIRPVYGNGGSRPTEFVVRYDIEGQIFTPPPIKNTPTGD